MKVIKNFAVAAGLFALIAAGAVEANAGGVENAESFVKHLNGTYHSINSGEAKDFMCYDAYIRAGDMVLQVSEVKRVSSDDMFALDAGSQFCKDEDVKDGLQEIFKLIRKVMNGGVKGYFPTESRFQ